MSIKSIKAAVTKALKKTIPLKFVIIALAAVSFFAGVVALILGEPTQNLFVWAMIGSLWYDTIVLKEAVNKVQRLR